MTTADPDAVLSLALLRAWNGRLDPDSIGGAVYQVLLQRLTRAILGPRLGPELLRRYLGLGTDPALNPINEFQGAWSVTLLRWLADPSTGWLADPVERQALIERCLAETTAELRQCCGNDPSHWSWGHLHQITFPHSLGAQPPLDRIFNLGPYPIGGDGNTVTQVAIKDWRPAMDKPRPPIPNPLSVSSRYVIDLGDLGHAWAMLTPGQSGHLGSPHYDDLIQPWLRGDYFPMTWMADEVTAVTKHTLILLPTPTGTYASKANDRKRRQKSTNS